MDTLVELQQRVDDEFQDGLDPVLPREYGEAIKDLKIMIYDLLSDPSSIAWEDAQEVAEIQLQVCGIIEQILS